ncbi:MAG: hypothetical protein ACOC57_02680 [Acidobacteriota bacterium]
MKKLHSIISILAILLVSLFLSSCNPIEDESRSPSILVLLNLTGSDIEGNEANFLQSDVVKLDEDSGGTYVTADTASATLTAKLLQPESQFGSSQYNSIMLTRYIVSYYRTDGKNSQGVDVPYSFEGSLSTLIEIDQSVDISFIIVREVAKLEPPLINLADGRAEGTITVTAKVEFYGHDLTNNTVKTTGYLTIYFANYIDE